MARKIYWALSGALSDRNEGRGLKELFDGFFRYERYYLNELTVDNDLEPFPLNLSKAIKYIRRKIQIEWLKEGSTTDIQSYFNFRTDISRQNVVKWLRSGHTTVLARYKGRIIGDCWLAFRAFPFIDEDIAGMLERRGYAYSFKAYVHPQYRGLRIFPLLVSEQVEVVRLKAMKGLFSAVSPGNAGSGQSHEIMGFKRIGTLHTLHMGNRGCLVKLIETR